MQLSLRVLSQSEEKSTKEGSHFLRLSKYYAFSFPQLLRTLHYVQTACTEFYPNLSLSVGSMSTDLFAPIIKTVIQQTFTKLPNSCKQTTIEFRENPADGSFADTGPHTSPAAAVGR